MCVYHPKTIKTTRSQGSCDVCGWKEGTLRRLRGGVDLRWAGRRFIEETFARDGHLHASAAQAMTRP